MGNLIKQIKTLEKEKVTKESFVTKMEIFEKKWTEVTKKVKLISNVQKETNKLWNINQELKENLSKDVDTLKSQVAQLVSSQQTQQSLSEVTSEMNSLATLRQKVEKTKDILNANSLAIYSAITKVTSTSMESEKFIEQVRNM